jgi:outer membrane lipoprotein SlyB
MLYGIWKSRRFLSFNSNPPSYLNSKKEEACSMYEGVSVLAGLLFGGIKQYGDTRTLNQGEMYRKEYAVETTENVTGGLGVWAGVEYGGMLGTSVLPGFGTVAGAVLGGVLGAKVGTSVGHQAGSAVFTPKSPILQKLSDTTEPVIEDTKITARKFAVKAAEMVLDLSEKAKETASGMRRQWQSVVQEARDHKTLH